MPVFNAAPTLQRAIESIRRQTFRDWRLLAVDDGSSDQSLRILEGLAFEEPRLQVMHQDHAGIVAALRSALDQSASQLVARMDADDLSHPDRLATQVQFLEQHPEIGLVGCRVEFGGDRLRAAGYAWHVDWMNSLVSPEQISLNRFVESPFAHPSVLFRRRLLEAHGGYHEGDFPEDYELWLRWLDAGVLMGKVPETLFTWNDPPDRLSRVHPRYDVEAFYRCKAGYLARWLQAHVSASRSILVWGAGRPTRKRADHLAAHGVRISGYIDIDPRKQGRRFADREVIPPNRIPPASTVFVLGYVAKRGARELARSSLRGRGLVEGRDFLFAA
jgi:glycosyltransferase involved in cell wall biosynthesis